MIVAGQSCVYTDPSSPKFPSHLDCHLTQSIVLCAMQWVLLVFHFKYISVYMSIPHSPAITSPYPVSWTEKEKYRTTSLMCGT